MTVMEKTIIDFPTFMELMRRAGLKPEEEVFVSVRPQRIEISTNPAEALWGTLKSNRSAEELRLEAYEDLGEYLNAKIPG
ncbi:MAG: hypothetical protein FJY85_14030 [Deltaproteobacteria bacterium]|nr:hypothetical protein [Deltaproteobacteria bacterium]